MTAAPVPRPAVADRGLTRPDWTVSVRDTKGLIALDKNETTDPELRRLIAEMLKALPPEAAIEYPECAPYYHLLAEHLGLSPHSLLFTHGSDGAIRSVFEAFLSPGETVLITSPTFAMFPVYTQMYGGRAVELTYQASEQGPVLSLEDICGSLRKHRPRLFCLPNPDSPTGAIFGIDELTKIIKTAADVGTVILIDEAYYPFSDVTAIGLIDDFANMVVTQTFAKAWGLAGIRLGFAAAHPEMTAILHKVRPMYEVNGLALAAMAEIIRHKDQVRASVERINDGKKYFLERMRGHGLRTLNGAGNFLHVDFGDRREAVFDALNGKVLYRKSFSAPCLAGFSRFTAAPEMVTTRLANIIDGVLGRGLFCGSSL